MSPALLSRYYDYGYSYYDDNSLTVGAIAGIVVGAIAFLSSIIAGIVFCCCMSKRRKRERKERDAREIQMATQYQYSQQQQPLMYYTVPTPQPGGPMQQPQPMYAYGQQPAYGQQLVYGQPHRELTPDVKE